MFFFSSFSILQISKKTSLRVHSHTVMDTEKRTSQSVSNRGSMTIEAAIVLPLLLCAFMGIILWGKLFIVSHEIETALLETARQIAGKEHLLTLKDSEGSGIYLAHSIFAKARQQGDAAEGIEVSFVDLSESRYIEDTGEVFLTAKYKVKLPLLLFGTWQISMKSHVRQKAWNGYRPLPSDKSAQGNYVYITEDGEVYHKSSQCYHLHVSVEEVNDVRKYYDGKTAFRPCEYCVSGKMRKGVLFITDEGGCYHEDLSCGGLTRRVHCVSVDQMGGKRPCEDCCKEEN